jgi:branched-chain amino acid transport system permease protein
MKRCFNNTNFWAAVIVAVLPLFLPEKSFRFLSLAAIYAIAALGLSLLLGCAGQISLGVAAFVGIGAYTTAILTTRFHWPSVLAFFSAIIASSAIAFVIGKPVLKMKGFFLALATLGFNEIFFIFVSRTDPVVGGLYGIGGVPYFSIAGYEISNYVRMYYLDWAILLGFLLFSENMVNSRVGRALLAIHADEVAASAMGVDVAKFKLKLFVLSGAYAGTAGSLLANYLSTAQPDGFTLELSVFILLSVVFGGMGKLWGTVIATVILTWLKDEKLTQYQEYSSLIFGIIIIFVFIFLPQGVGSLFQRLMAGTKFESLSRKFKFIFRRMKS